MTRTRLSVIDDIFLRTHRGFGLPIVLQGIWRSDEHVRRIEFAAVHADLALGRLGRRVVTPSIPGARRRWEPSTESLPLQYEDTPLLESQILRWSDAQGEVDLDPEHGPGWRMSAAALDTGGTVMSLVCSHALADASGLITAAGKAFEGNASPTGCRRTSDIADALSLVSRVSASAVRATAGLIASRVARDELAAYRRRSRTTQYHRARVSTAVFDIDAVLSNAEFISVVAEIAAELGEPDPVTVNIPFRSKVKGSNRIGMATIEVRRTETASDIKAATKRAFDTPAGAPSGFPAEAVQLLSDERAAALTSSPGTARVLCSNIGVIPDAITSLAGHPARALATRAIHPNADRSQTPTALSAYISTMGSTTTLSLVGTVDHFVPILTTRAAGVLSRRELRYKSW